MSFSMLSIYNISSTIRNISNDLCHELGNDLLHAEKQERMTEPQTEYFNVQYYSNVAFGSNEESHTRYLLV